MNQDCNFTPATCHELGDVRVKVGRTEERLSNLEDWQRSQNSQLKDIGQRIDKLLLLVITLLATSTGTLALIILR